MFLRKKIPGFCKLNVAKRNLVTGLRNYEELPGPIPHPIIGNLLDTKACGKLLLLIEKNLAKKTALEKDFAQTAKFCGLVVLS